MVWGPLIRLLRPSRPQNDARPWLLEYRSSKTFIMATIAAAVFTDVFLYAVIVPVLPFALSSRTGVADSEVQSWVSILVAVYGGSLALFSPICGWLADASPNRRLPLIVGLFSLAGATVMLNLGRSVGVLIAGRLLQGGSAAVVWIVGLALVSDTVDSSEIGEAMGYIFSAMSIGILVGPLLGGVVLDKAGYNAVFGMCYAIVGVDIAMRFILIEKKVARKWESKTHDAEVRSSIEKQPDLPRSEPCGPTGAAGEMNDETLHFKGDKTVSAEDGIGANAETSQYLQAELPAPIPTPKHAPTMVTLIKSRRLLNAMWACVVVSSIFTQFDSVLPLFVKETFNWGATASGLIFIPFVIPSFFSPVVGFLVDKYGPRWFAAVGFVLVAPFEIMLRLVDHNSIGQKVLLCALLTLIGVSLNLAMPPMMAEITYTVEQKERKRPGLFGANGAYAQAYGLFNFAWAIGSLIGPIWAGFVKQKAGWGTMAWSFALLSFLTAVPTFIWTGGSIFDKTKRRGVSQECLEMGPSSDVV